MRLATFVTGALAMSAFVIVLGCAVEKPAQPEPAAPGAPSAAGAPGAASTSSAMPASIPAAPAK
jgi:hypothetical protein